MTSMRDGFSKGFLSSLILFIVSHFILPSTQLFRSFFKYHFLLSFLKNIISFIIKFYFFYNDNKFSAEEVLVFLFILFFTNKIKEVFNWIKKDIEKWKLFKNLFFQWSFIKNCNHLQTGLYLPLSMSLCYSVNLGKFLRLLAIYFGCKLIILNPFCCFS